MLFLSSRALRTATVTAASFALIGASACVGATPAFGVTLPPVPTPSSPSSPGGLASTGLPSGLYVQVIDGLVHLTNPSGTQQFGAGQFGYAANFAAPPVVLPNNPNMQFRPPPTLNASGVLTPQQQAAAEANAATRAAAESTADLEAQAAAQKAAQVAAAEAQAAATRAAAAAAAAVSEELAAARQAAQAAAEHEAAAEAATASAARAAEAQAKTNEAVRLATLAAAANDALTIAQAEFDAADLLREQTASAATTAANEQERTAGLANTAEQVATDSAAAVAASRAILDALPTAERALGTAYADASTARDAAAIAEAAAALPNASDEEKAEAVRLSAIAADAQTAADAARADYLSAVEAAERATEELPALIDAETAAQRVAGTALSAATAAAAEADEKRDAHTTAATEADGAAARLLASEETAVQANVAAAAAATLADPAETAWLALRALAAQAAAAELNANAQLSAALVAMMARTRAELAASSEAAQAFALQKDDFASAAQAIANTAAKRWLDAVLSAQVQAVGALNAAATVLPFAPVGAGPLGGVATRVVPGQALTLTGSGFAPGTLVTVAIYSTPVPLATVRADAQGNVSIPITVPTGYTGHHSLVATGTAADGSALSLRSDVNVDSSAPATAASSPAGTATATGTAVLAETGLDPIVPLGAAALALLLGVGIVSRRRFSVSITT